MCQSKAEGGHRCTDTPAGKAMASLRKTLRNLTPGTIEYRNTEDGIKRLQAARKQYGNCVHPFTSLEIPAGVEALMDKISNRGNNPLLVGGTIRDAVTGGHAPKDFDIEVYGSTIDDIAKDLRRDGYRVDEVGKSFGVLKVALPDGDDIDISVPRRDSLTGEGHRGFTVEMDSDISIEEATARRDFTFNAMMYDYRQQVIIDPHNGMEDLSAGVIKHVSDAFAEDPLRCLRAFQFASRFDMTLHPETALLCRKLSVKSSELPAERIATEWDKFFTKGKNPEAGLNAIREMGWNNHVTGLSSINKVGSTLSDSMNHAREACSENGFSQESKTAIMKAVMIRRMPENEARDFAGVVSIGHKERNKALGLRNVAVDSNDYSIRKASKALADTGNTLQEWAVYEQASGDSGFAVEVLRKANALGVDKTPEAPFLMGRHLMEAGYKPGKWMGALLADVQELQFQGKLRTTDEAMDWARRKLESDS